MPSSPRVFLGLIVEFDDGLENTLGRFLAHKELHPLHWLDA